MTDAPLLVFGGGLAGTEAAWQAAEHGMAVRLIEMRPARETGAHRTDALAELVCSNSLGSQLPDRATGLLLHELDRLGSLLYRCASAAAVPAGGAMAVDRAHFAARVTEAVASHPRIRIERREATEVPVTGLAIVATGPLTSPAMAEALQPWTGGNHLYFYDALAPIVRADSLDPAHSFRASRYGRGVREEGDYVNCPMDAPEYARFVAELAAAERIPLRDFEQAIDRGVRAGEGPHFEGCLPIEVLAARGAETLAFGPLRPVGLRDPRTGRRPHAVVQLRQEDAAGEALNMVGFQTNLRRSEQARVFRLVPGLAQAAFLRFGQMHRNTYLNAPRLLRPTLQHRVRPTLFFAGQIAGLEGYAASIGAGLVAGRNAARIARGLPPETLPETTMLGALLRTIASAAPEHFQPMKANLGILPLLPDAPRGKRPRAAAHAQRAREAMELWLSVDQER